MQRSAWRRGLGNLLLAGVSLVVALVVVELGLRIYFYGSLARPDYSMSFHEPHPTRGWTFSSKCSATEPPNVQLAFPAARPSPTPAICTLPPRSTRPGPQARG